MSPQPSPTPEARTRPCSRTSWRLLARARLGDRDALGELVSRCLPALRRFARGRLPRWARDLADTPDLVQDAVVRTLGRLDTLDLQGRGALAAYLREAVRNRIRDEHRQLGRRGQPRELGDALADASPSPLESVVAARRERRYRQALDALDPVDRELIVAHVELGFTHRQLGCMTGRSANAARMALGRAIRRLAERLRDA